MTFARSTIQVEGSTSASSRLYQIKGIQYWKNMSIVSIYCFIIVSSSVTISTTYAFVSRQSFVLGRKRRSFQSVPNNVQALSSRISIPTKLSIISFGCNFDKRGHRNSVSLQLKKENIVVVDDNNNIIQNEDFVENLRSTDLDNCEQINATITSEPITSVWDTTTPEQRKTAIVEVDVKVRVNVEKSISSTSSSSSLEEKRNKLREMHKPTSVDNNDDNKSVSTNPKKQKEPLLEHRPKMLLPGQSGFNVVLTHATADFDSLASAVGLAKLWSHDYKNAVPSGSNSSTSVPTKTFDSASHVPTFVVLPRGAHPGVQRFLALHKYLFPIRSLKSLPDDLTKLNRLALVDAQRRDRIGPATPLLDHAKRVTVVDHHVDQDSDIVATDYVVDKVGSVSTLIVERLQQAGISLTEPEATLMALGIHADTGSLCFDSTTVRDALALAWCLHEGASQTAIAEHAQSSLSAEQQGVLTQALINTNTTVVHGVTVSTVLLSADGFIQGLAAVTQDALELSSSDVFLLGLVYHPKSGNKRKKKSKTEKDTHNAELLTHRWLAKTDIESKDNIMNSSSISDNPDIVNRADDDNSNIQTTVGDEEYRLKRLRAAFDRIDITRTGYIEKLDVTVAMSSSGIVLSDASSVSDLIRAVDKDGDGRIDFDEFVEFATRAELKQKQQLSTSSSTQNKAPAGCTMIIIGRVKAGVNMKAVKLNRLLEVYGGGGHPKAASATIRLENESDGPIIMQKIVDELISTSLQSQPIVGDFMTSPVLTVKQHMTEMQVENLFSRYAVRALPVVDDDENIVGLVTYQLVEAAKQRMMNKELKRIRQEREKAAKLGEAPAVDSVDDNDRKRNPVGSGSTVKGWMLQHVQTIDESTTMAEVESILLESDVGSLPVVADGTRKLVGMVTRTDVLRQHRYYDTLPYHNKGFADSIAARKPIIELRKKLKQFDLD